MTGGDHLSFAAHHGVGIEPLLQATHWFTTHSPFEATVEKNDRYARLKTERAELGVIRVEFRDLFEREL